MPIQYRKDNVETQCADWDIPIHWMVQTTSVPTHHKAAAYKARAKSPWGWLLPHHRIVVSLPLYFYSVRCQWCIYMVSYPRVRQTKTGPKLYHPVWSPTQHEYLQMPAPTSQNILNSTKSWLHTWSIFTNSELTKSGRH